MRALLKEATADRVAGAGSQRILRHDPVTMRLAREN
jgi:hypothetical protein